MQRKVTETHPQSGRVKRLSLAGAKPLRLTTITKLSAVFPMAQSCQSRAKMGAKIGSAGTQNHNKLATRAPQKTLKKNTKSWTRSPFWCQKRNSVSRLFGAFFEVSGWICGCFVRSPTCLSSRFLQLFRDYFLVHF